MYGVIIAFKDYRPTRPIEASPWAGFYYFQSFFKDPYFFRLLRNTVSISGLSILFGFPAPIILALLLNEIRNVKFKRVVQTVSYMPHFISLVVVCGIIKTYTQTNGLFNDIVVLFGGERSNMLMDKSMFYPIYVLSGIWQEVGWGSIIYLAAIAGIDQEQYEAARIDGAGRLRQIISITLPGLLPTITIMFILRMGSVLSVGQEKVMLLYTQLTYDVSDVISTYVYRRGLLDADYSFSTAVGLFNSAINIFFLLITNAISRKVNDSSLF